MNASIRDARGRRREGGSVPLLWTFDGPFATCLADADDALRRAIVQLGEVSAVVAALDISLPALARRVAAGESVQPAWQRFLAQVAGYGLPTALRVRPRRDAGPLATLVIFYRSSSPWR